MQQPGFSDSDDAPPVRPIDRTGLTGQRPGSVGGADPTRPRSIPSAVRTPEVPVGLAPVECDTASMPGAADAGDHFEARRRADRIKVVVDTLRDMRFREPRRADILVFVMALWATGLSIDDALALRETRFFDGRGVARRELDAGLAQVRPALRGLGDEELQAVWAEVARHWRR